MENSLRILLVLMATLLASPTWAEDEEVAVPKAIYYAIPEPFTINFLNQSNQLYVVKTFWTDCCMI